MINQRYLYLMILPCMVSLVIFAYIPMPGVILAFKDYRASKGIYGSDWVGLMWFEQFFRSPLSMQVLRNTININLIMFFLGFPVPIIFAVLVNEMVSKRYMKTVQTISYLPHFLSWVIVGLMFTRLLSIDGGIVNVLLENLGFKPKHFFAEPKYVYGLAYFTQIWKETGWSAIIYLAALTSVNPELYEAAAIDGAKKMRRIWHVSLPGIRGTILILLILNAGSLMNTNLSQMMVLGNDANIARSDVLSTYIYRRVLQDIYSYGYATAMGLFNSVVNIFFLLTVNFIVRKSGENSLF